MIFQKDRKVKINGKLHHVIVCDEETAVLGKVKKTGAETSISYINCAVYPNFDNLKDCIAGLEFV